MGTERKHSEQEMKQQQQQQQPGYSVTLNKETYDLLMSVKGNLVEQLGFEPTNGQVVRHLIAVFYNSAN
jgi:hypothetical protein